MSTPDEIFNAFVSRLTGDNGAAGFATLATGGIYSDRVEIKPPPNYPTPPFDANGQIEPCALIKPEIVIPSSSAPLRKAAQLPIVIIAYDAYANGHSTIEAMLSHAYVLLDDERLPGVNNWQVRESQQGTRREDTVLDCNMGWARYVVQMHRV
ncbi:MAG: hypothetical protein GY943_16800 [Chloroflexi bacterium]|nr:hypothetical protein [Chloroflexota bacterium]